MVEIEFNSEKEIFETKFVGEVSLAEVLNYFIKIKEDSTLPRKLKIKIDGRKAFLKFTINDLEEIKVENYKALEQYDFIMIAVIMDTPQMTAISLLYKELIKCDKFIFNVFSTENVASQWLQNGIN
jgi:sulfite reductase beta subunit-like hemoprotein